jgi:antitoxin ParD1/3/4
MEEQDRLREAKLAQLRNDVRQGLASGPSEPWDAAALKSEAHAWRTNKKAPASMPRARRVRHRRDGQSRALIAAGP